MIITRTPFRVSFFGGGTDYPIWFREKKGSVISLSVNKYCYISCRFLPQFFEHKHRFVYSKIEMVKNINDIKHPAIKGVLKFLNWKEGGLEIHHDGDLPARSGLGSSSAFTVGLLHSLEAMRGKRYEKNSLAKDAIHVEQNIIKESVGSQDQVAVTYGGFNKIDFYGKNEFSVNPIVLPEKKLKEFEESLLLVYTGISRFSSEIASKKINNINKKKNELNDILKIVDEASDALTNLNKPIGEIGKMLHETWKIKKSLAKEISNSKIDDIYQTAIKSGAIGGKLLGAGAGGFFIFLAQKKHHKKLIKNLFPLICVPFKIDFSGSSVITYQPDYI